MATKLGLNAKALQVVKASQVEIGDVQCFLESWAIYSSLLHVNLYSVRKHDCFVPLCCGDLIEGPLHYLMLAWGFVDPNTKATTLAGTYQRASASGSLTGPCQKLLPAVFQLSVFIVVCSADLWAITCHGSDVMCAAAACPEQSYFVFRAATISVLLLSRWELHYGPKQAERSLHVVTYCAFWENSLV